MLIGQSLFVPGTGTPGVRYYGPWAYSCGRTY